MPKQTYHKPPYPSLPLSLPAASKFASGCTASIQNLSCSLLNVSIKSLFFRSQILIVLSSELLTKMSSFWGKATEETFCPWPYKESCSQAFVSTYFHNFTFLSSAPEAIRLLEGWKQHQLTPLSCPSSTHLSSTSLAL